MRLEHGQAITPIVLTMAAAGSYERFMRCVGIKALKLLEDLEFDRQDR
jgi:hypothetical protein